MPRYNTRSRSKHSKNQIAYIDRMAARYRALFAIGREPAVESNGAANGHLKVSHVDDAGVLLIDKVDFCARDNATRHHTAEYELISEHNAPVLRRGLSFQMTLSFRQRSYDASNDKLNLTFSFGSKPNVAKGTKAVMLVSDDGIRKSNTWQAAIVTSHHEQLVVEVFIPVSAPVGTWECSVTTSLLHSATSHITHPCCQKDVYILFNPWNAKDATYMENDVWRKEYVENDQGKVFQMRYGRGTPWMFGQYNDVVLPAACYILEKSKLKATERNNPVKVVRALSAVINSYDNNGVLEGNWSDDFSDGIEPWVWTGSVKILQQYLAHGEPVKYGQCWVFSAVFTTVCRALGLPCRSVTNFSSAHDTDATLTIDNYFDKNMKPIDVDDCSDSIWNFHVWNDVWMARNDLPEGYGGWQAVDATPQEESDGIMQCGPASLEAIKRGEVNLPYDVPFVYSEVNADIFDWKQDPTSDSGFTLIKKNIDTNSVGKAILTKQAEVDDDDADGDREDIIRQYKNPEGGEAIKWSVLNAVGAMDRASEYYNIPTDKEEDVVFTLHDIEEVNVGDPFHVEVTIKNNAAVVRTVEVLLSAYSVYYNGVKAKELTNAGGTYKVGPSDSEVIFIELTADEYWNKLVAYGLIKIYAMANVKETKQVWGNDDDFVMKRPSLNIHSVSSAAVGETFEAKFSFSNPLPMPLTDCKISLEASDLKKPDIVTYAGDVKAGGLVEYVAKFTAKKAGKRKIIAKFTSRELINITGSKTITVK